jgi:hypothetical protein
VKLPKDWALARELYANEYSAELFPMPRELMVMCMSTWIPN